ncbi:MAG: PDZ domain-containing protein [Parachlamydiales bacterium]|nr:PDZ domain-containing protein [Candidatus Acheromyda pituitae]
MKILRKPFVLILLFLTICSYGTPQRLKKQDVRKTMQEMLAYHVEYKEFSSLLARRSLKLYIQQFDMEKNYLFASEAKTFLDPRDERVQSAVRKYQKDDLSEFAAANQVIQNSIMRARRIRAEVERELILSNENFAYPQGESYLDYARNEDELRSRIRRQLVRLLVLEKKWNDIADWTPQDKQKIFALWEKRLGRYETPYLTMDSNGNSIPAETVDHYLSLHTLKAMAKSLDAHTSYFSPEEAFEMRASLEKQFEGVGIVLREGISGVVISDLIKGGPADKSGKITPGDLIVKIDGKSVEGASYEEILTSLQGSGSSMIRIGFNRKTGKQEMVYYEVDLKREKIVMQDERLQYTFEPYADGIIAKLTLPSFYESGNDSSCEKDIRDALRELRKEGPIYGVVLDMRENSGGFLNQAVKVAGLFISSGVVVISKYSQGEVQYLRDIDGRSYYSGPLVILTSKASASAAEIVAQALQDYGVALVVGDERTYGKGTIQYQTVTDDHASVFFKVTVGRYYTVSGRSTQIEGVKADILVPTFYSAFNIGEKYLEYALKSDRIAPAYVDPLTDVDLRNRAWFQRNYVPHIQKKLSVWNQMLPTLKDNSSFRLKLNKNYQLFLSTLEAQASNRFSPTIKQNWGADDLQMNEAVNILKDMIIIQAESSIPEAVGQ